MRAILTFHAIDDLASPLSFSPHLFAALLDGLAKAGTPVLPLDALLAGQGDGVALTFDDGYASVFTEALPLLRRHGYPAHLFLATGWVAGSAGRPMLSPDMVRSLHDQGMRIESHTHSHPDLRRSSEAEIHAEIDRADEEIERLVGRRPRYFAYPFGRHDRRVRAALGPRFDACLTTRLAYLSADQAADRLARLDSHYLRSPRMARDLFAPGNVAYIGLRNLIRTMRRRT